MIDKEKIDRVARICGSHFIGVNEDEAAQYGFKAGAAWALQEFKKSLWHDASEEPENGKKLVGYDLDGYSIYCWTDQEATWKEFVYNSTLQKWCYIYDLLPKEGGEQC